MRAALATMAVLQRIQQMLDRQCGENLFPYLSYDPSTRLLFLEGVPEDRNYVGALWMGFPVLGGDDSTVERLRSILADNYPKGTVIQFFLLSTPDIEAVVRRYVERRPFFNTVGAERSDPVMEEYLQRRTDFILSARDHTVPGFQGPLHDVQLMVAMKLPVSYFPTEDDLGRANATVTKFEEALNSLGFGLERLSVERFLWVLRRILHMFDDVSDSYDPDRLLRDQILAPGDRIEVCRDHLRLGETYSKILSVKHYPKATSLAMMFSLPGDPQGLNNQISCPYLMATSIYYPAQDEETARIRSRAQAINYQAYGPMLKFIPRLAYKKTGFDVLIHAMEQGETVVKVAFEMILFSRDPEVLQRNVGQIRTYWSVFQLEMAEEHYITWPVFCNTLPLFPTAASIANTKRFVTMGVRHATQFLPVLMDWKGTGDGAAMVFFTRRGEIALVDLYDSTTNYNGVIFAESGAGKSFLSQQIIMDYLSLGASIWVIDVGRSYEKLARVVGGEFIELSERSNVCLNPFTGVTNIDEDVELLRATLANMASYNSSLDDYMYARIEEAIKAVWGVYGPKATMTNVYHYLLQQSDPRLRDLGAMLFQWTDNGSYGVWFEGDCNLTFEKPLTVLELEELKGKKHLQKVVLLQLIAKIQQEMFLRSDGRPKLVIIDEAWDLLDDPGTAKFMEHGYRRFRKYGGAAIIITQSLNDLYGSPNGRAILDNSSHLFIMKQRSETIRSLAAENKLNLDGYWLHQLETVHTVPGRYSEVFISTTKGEGIVRLVVDQWSQVLFSTTGPERHEILGAIHSGIPAIQAIDEFLASRKNTIHRNIE